MMLQDIWPHRLRNQFTDKTDPTPDSPVFCFRKADLLTASSRDDAMEEEIDQSGEHGKISMPEAGTAGSEEKDFYRMRGRYLKLPTVKQLGEDREYIFLFSMDGGAFFLLSGDIADEDIPEGFEFKNIRTMRSRPMAPSTVCSLPLRPISWPTGTEITASAGPAAHPQCIRIQSARCAAQVRQDDLSPHHSRSYCGRPERRQDSAHKICGSRIPLLRPHCRLHRNR